MPRRSGDDGDESPAGGSRTGSFSANTPLVIVSERGRHDEASRRVVRAQAARASAPQSRLTRARNREEREAREGPAPSPAPPPPEASDHTQLHHFLNLPGVQATADKAPLLAWLVSSIPSVAEGVLQEGVDTVSNIGSSLQQIGSASAPPPLMSIVPANTPLEAGRQLPMAIPRGFSDLGKRVDMDDGFMLLISRTACFDFGSSGVESRLHTLLVDLIMSSVGAGVQTLTSQGQSSQSSQSHPIQGHLRIACTCLTIFQGQRADGQAFASDPRYNAGLSAAWSEAILLDQEALSEPKTAHVSLWAVFIISVTTGANAAATYFQQVLHGLFHHLNLKGWEQARSILLDFIYPGSFLEEPCKNFFQTLQELRVGLV